MSVVRVGATKKFADNWEAIFGGRKAKSAAKPKSAKKKSAAKKKASRGKKKAR
jgi:hypothetical protein